MKEEKQKSKKTIYHVVYIFLGLFVLVMGYYSYFLLVQSKDVINNAYNRRQEVLSERVIRGDILSAEGEVLARTRVLEDGSEIREYPYNDMFVHVVGRLLRGKSGIEESENIRLLTSSAKSVENLYNDLTGQKNIGDQVITTLNASLQKVAYEALGSNRGVVVVLEPATGKILAMVSKPGYDPNSIDVMWNTLVEDEGTESPLINRATQGLYPPGSTFKLLTALAYMRENPEYRIYDYDCNGSISYNNMKIRCYNNTSHGKVDLLKSFAKSCNTSFASIGKELDLSAFHSLCESFLFNQRLPVGMVSSPGRFTLNKGAGLKEAMQTAIGQGKTLITPLHNAMIAATVANDGVMMKPYVVDFIRNANGQIVKRYGAQSQAKLLTMDETYYLGKMMREVVVDGTASLLKGLSVEVAGKTGSADQEGKPAHAWFIGYAPYDKPKIAVSIIVESVGTGSNHAVPIAKQIFETYFPEE